MQAGPSRHLFEHWAPDVRNGVIITGYSIEGTLARVSATQSALINLASTLPLSGYPPSASELTYLSFCIILGHHYRT